MIKSHHQNIYFLILYVKRYEFFVFNRPASRKGAGDTEMGVGWGAKQEAPERWAFYFFYSEIGLANLISTCDTSYSRK
jgi:hypothetical protein